MIENQMKKNNDHEENKRIEPTPLEIKLIKDKLRNEMSMNFMSQDISQFSDTLEIKQ